jgi:DNA-binding NtrC family response regulator
MGVDAVQRQNAAPAGAATPGYSAPAQPAASAYALNVTDAGGQIRKFEELESEIIRMAIARYDGHMSEVARRLGIGRSTLYRKLKEFGLEGHAAENLSEDGTAIEDAIRQAG